MSGPANLWYQPQVLQPGSAPVQAQPMDVPPLSPMVQMGGGSRTGGATSQIMSFLGPMIAQKLQQQAATQQATDQAAASSGLTTTGSGLSGAGNVSSVPPASQFGVSGQGGQDPTFGSMAWLGQLLGNGQQTAATPAPTADTTSSSPHGALGWLQMLLQNGGTSGLAQSLFGGGSSNTIGAGDVAGGGA